MNPWPKLDPHDNHSEFAFNETTNNPVKGGKLQLGRGRVPVPQDPKTRAWHWAMFSNELMGKIETLNALLLAYKTTAAQDAKDEFKKQYKRVANEIDAYVKKGGTFDNQYAEKGSVGVEAIEAGGFTIGIRLFGVAIDKTRGPRNHHSSSSYYSFYSACQGS